MDISLHSLIEATIPVSTPASDDEKLKEKIDGGIMTPNGVRAEFEATLPALPPNDERQKLDALVAATEEMLENVPPPAILRPQPDWGNLMRRKGRARIPFDMLPYFWLAIQNNLNWQIVIFRAEFCEMFARNEMIFEGCSMLFDPLDDGAMLPEYVFEISEERSEGGRREVVNVEARRV